VWILAFVETLGPPRGEAESRKGGRESATADLGPWNARREFVTRLQSGKAILEKLQAVKNFRISIDVNQDACQPAPL
jgi:hypothetical protein